MFFKLQKQTFSSFFFKRFTAMDFSEANASPTPRWEELPRLSRERCAAAAVTWKGQLFVLGGCDEDLATLGEAAVAFWELFGKKSSVSKWFLSIFTESFLKKSWASFWNEVCFFSISGDTLKLLRFRGWRLGFTVCRHPLVAGRCGLSLHGDLRPHRSTASLGAACLRWTTGG